MVNNYLFEIALLGTCAYFALMVSDLVQDCNALVFAKRLHLRPPCQLR